MQNNIIIRGAREHNLKNIDINIPREKLVVFTGLSGSGKSSLAFDTIYAEGQRRFLESLSAYARQFMGMMERPDVDFIDGLSPVISIDQKTTNRNPRSTVGTVTEIYDFLRLLYARVATPYSYKSGNKMEKQTSDQIVAAIMDIEQGTKAYCLAPVVRGRKGHYRELFEQMQKQGFVKARVDGELIDLEGEIKLDRYKTHNIEVVVDRFVISPKSEKRISESVHMALEMADGNLVLGIQTKEGIRDKVYSKNLYDPESGLSYEDPAPNLFSFNSPYGACKTCNGLGYRYDVSQQLVIPNTDESIADGGLRFFGKPRDIFVFKQMQAVLESFNLDFETPLKDFPEEVIDVLFDGAGDQKFDVSYDFKNSNVTYKHKFAGIRSVIREQYEESKSNKQRDKAKAYLSKVDCSTCGGGRLNKEALSYKIDGHSIHDLVQQDIESLRHTVTNLNLTERQRKIGHQVLKEVIDRLDFLLNVGLSYLSLNREAQTLSGGEAQRIRLATQIGTQLVGVLYILDEPSIGLHQRDNIKLIKSLETLRDLGNSVIVVEHDRETIEHADYVVDLGPGAGTNGGEIVTEGTPDELDESALTTRFLKDLETIPYNPERREGTGKSIRLNQSSGHNLKDVDLEIPLGKFICVTGVSGSGKSTLINQTLEPILATTFYNSKSVPLPYQKIEGLDNVDKVISIDQSPIGRTPRSNPGTYTKVFDHIRSLFAELPESKIRGYDQGRFSFNVKGGRCETCKGDGVRKIEMNFLPDVYVDCEVCNGHRYNRETLEIHYKGKNISDVLKMPVSEASEFFDSVPAIKRKLKTLNSVGLGYLTLGQSSTTVSGGEAQRIKLSRELSKIGTGDTMYIMDEPTTGLHFQDVRMLVDVIQKLVEKGNTVIVIEHNLDLIKAADWVIDMGPEGGDGGGEIIAEGTPETVAEVTKSHTGQFLKQEFAREKRLVKK
ncbi:excinuclease ABC subunit UvrA [Rhodohalobacter sp. SW132]|uniref:excinuclease ABC subunit UvrA n=1 Tax=Rhodohalobacter sp. SW132 TaxID=2293433 RepID=UPI000E241A4F|nr:excinuclease ABC subunit UvrA [Rhodohalobacter sp. SW132]REL33074.1 excinuclease ABC subunit UvrA [Rhodohalobacter sp. SW132]